MKNHYDNPWVKTLENLIFFVRFQQLKQELGLEGWPALFIIILYKYVSGKVKHKLLAAAPVLRWYFFNLNKIKVLKKEKFLHF